MGVKQARGFGGLACPRALHAICLRERQQSVVTPGQRALLDTRRSARYAKSLRQLALAEYGSSSGGRCEARAAVHSDPQWRSEVDLP